VTRRGGADKTYLIVGALELEDLGLASCSNGNIALIQDFLHEVVSKSC
jgi:hypothetical protein